MSVLIKGFDMPESCYYCLFIEGSWSYSPPKRVRCIITGKDMPVDERFVQHKHTSCPLVEIPTPHGKLVDKQEIIRNSSNSWTKDDWFNSVVNAPTVIEAEDGEA